MWKECFLEIMMSMNWMARPKFQTSKEPNIPLIKFPLILSSYKNYLPLSNLQSDKIERLAPHIK